MIDWETFKSQLETNPGKVLKSVLLLAGSFLLIWILVVVQSESPTQNRVKVEASGRLDSLKMSTARTGTDSLAATPTNQAKESSQGLSTTASDTDFFGIFPKALLAFIAIGCVWVWLRSKKGSKTATPKGNVFTTVGTQQLPGGQHLTVTKLNGEYWVMATGGTEGVSLLHRYSADEWNGLNEAPEKSDWTQTFMTTLKNTASQPKKTG